MKTKNKIFRSPLSLLCGAVAMLTANQGLAAPSYLNGVICDLDVIGSGTCPLFASFAHAIDRQQRRIVGSASTDTDCCYRHAFFTPQFTPGFGNPDCPAGLTDLLAPGSTFGIHSGWIVGTRYDAAASAYRGFKTPGPPYGAPGVVDIGTLGGANSVAYGLSSVNPSLDVVGASQVLLGPNQPFHAFILTGESTTLPLFGQDLGTFGGANSVAYDVNDRPNPEVVGAAETVVSGPALLHDSDTGGQKKILPFGSDGSGKYHAFFHVHSALGQQLGPADDLGTFNGGTTYGDNSVAYAVNNQSVVVGASQFEAGSGKPFHAFVHVGPGPLDFLADDIHNDNNPSLFLSSVAYAVNSDSEVVGTGFNGQEFRAFLWLPPPTPLKYGLPPGMHDLNDPGVSPAALEGWTLIQATGIDNFGNIVGTGIHNGNLRAFLLRPGNP
jgi:uncharacterized membrane protein